MNISKFQRAGLVVSSVIVAASLAACASPNQQYRGNGYQQGAYQQGAYQAPARGTEYGRVNNIYALQGQGSQQTSGAGAIIGAVVGGVLGNQIGKGSGRTAATGVGIVGGALAGNAVEARNGDNRGAGAYRIVIGLDQGGQRDYDVSSPGDLRVGDRVRVVNGQISRY